MEKKVKAMAAWTGFFELASGTPSVLLHELVRKQNDTKNRNVQKPAGVRTNITNTTSANHRSQCG